MRRTLIFSLALFIVGLCSVDARACSCAGQSAACQEYWESSAVFIGTVIEGRVVTVKEGDYHRQTRAVRISIDEAFRGIEGAEARFSPGSAMLTADSAFAGHSNISSTRIALRAIKNCTPIFARARERYQKPIRTSCTSAG